MAEKVPQPGMEILPRSPAGAGSGVPPRLLLASDLAVGAAAQATRVAVRFGSLAWGAGAAVGHVVSGLPGVDSATRLLDSAARPLVDDGHHVRVRARSAAQLNTQRLLDAFVPGVVDALDIDAIVQRIDIDRLVRRIEIDDVVQRIDIDALVRRIDIDDVVRRIEIDPLVQRIDIDRLVRRIEIDLLVERIDVDALVGRIDVDRIAERIDVNEVVQRVDVDAIVEETELGTIVARSTSGFATAALDAARTQTAGVDTRVTRAVNRVLRRKEGEVPEGPPLLRGEQHAAQEGVDDTGASSSSDSPGGGSPL